MEATGRPVLLAAVVALFAAGAPVLATPVAPSVAEHLAQAAPSAACRSAASAEEKRLLAPIAAAMDTLGRLLDDLRARRAELEPIVGAAGASAQTMAIYRDLRRQITEAESQLERLRVLAAQWCG